MVNRLLQAGTLTLATLALRSALSLGVGCVATASQLRQKNFFLLFFFLPAGGASSPVIFILLSRFLFLFYARG